MEVKSLKLKEKWMRGKYRISKWLKKLVIWIIRWLVENHKKIKNLLRGSCNRKKHNLVGDNRKNPLLKHAPRRKRRPFKRKRRNIKKSLMNIFDSGFIAVQLATGYTSQPEYTEQRHRKCIYFQLRESVTRNGISKSSARLDQHICWWWTGSSWNAGAWIFDFGTALASTSILFFPRLQKMNKLSEKSTKSHLLRMNFTMCLINS